MSKVAIKVNSVNKAFKLPHEKQGSIKNAFVNVFRSSRTYEKQVVLNDINFEIKKGEFFGIAGRNGSGKSTLLKLIAGVYSPDSGNISINGKLTPFIELGVGFNPELTGRENVFLNGALLGFNRKEMLLMYNDIVQFAELEKFMDQKLKNYSSGMQVRLAFSIAVRADSEVLLFDEVLAVGDARFQKKCLDIFRELKKLGKTIILVSHSTADMERFCDRILVIDSGKQLGIFEAPEAISLYQELNIEENPTGQLKRKPKKRWGTREVEIDSVKVITEKGNKGVKTGESLTVQFKLSRKDFSKKQKIKVGFAIYDEDNVNISGPNSYKKDFAFKPSERTAEIEYVLPKNILNQGTYRITAATVDESEQKMYDHIIDVTKFDVVSDETHHGKIVLDGLWEQK